MAQPHPHVEALCRAHMDLVPSIAHNLRRIVGPRADVDDLIGDGYVGLVHAAQAWLELPAERRMAEFKSWAATFVRRAMVDGLRKAWHRKADNAGFHAAPDSLDRSVSYDTDATLGDTVEDSRADVVRIVEARERLVELTILGPDRPPRRRALAPAEIEALVGAAMGESAKVTAARLGKSLETVKSQRRKVIEKLGARDITNAVFLALREGVLEREAVAA